MNQNLPFFAYGFLKPGEISFLGIREYVQEVKQLKIPGILLLRDGITLYTKDRNDYVDGYLIYFKKDQESCAYSFIDSLEPDNLLRWEIDSYNKISFNILVGKQVERGSEPLREWKTVWEDPFFTAAIELLDETNISDFEGDMKQFFKLQMKYLLLWTIIERFSFLRYSLGANPAQKMKYLKENEHFKKALYDFINQERWIYSSENPKKAYKLDRNNINKSIDYYYQMRCNITHRGKAICNDFYALNDSYNELMLITKYILEKTKAECEDVISCYL